MKENVRFTVDIPRDFHTVLKKKAIEEGISLRQFVLMSLAETSVDRTPKNFCSPVLKT